MKTQHTAGPWSVATDEDWDGATVYAGKSYPAYARVVATCEGSDIPGRGGECRTEEAKANARLIASCPDLLNALESLVSELSERTYKDGQMMSASFVRGEVCSVKALESARIALAKAKGQE